jgi:hypothetical protein
VRAEGRDDGGDQGAAGQSLALPPDPLATPRCLLPPSKGGLPEIAGLIPRASAAMSTLEFTRLAGGGELDWGGPGFDWGLTGV